MSPTSASTSPVTASTSDRSGSATASASYAGPAGARKDAWQLSISGAVFAQFNLDASSMDLINADYIIGFPLSYRNGSWSARARLFHQSSHLGDDFLLQPQKPELKITCRRPFV